MIGIGRDHLAVMCVDSEIVSSVSHAEIKLQTGFSYKSFSM